MNKDVNCISLGTAVPPCKVEDMEQVFLDRLLQAQQYSGRKFYITSAYRSKVWEKSKGRNGLSSHCKGLAVDIAVRSGFERLNIVRALIISGFRRIGIAKTFVHVDVDESKSNSIWLYE